MYACHTTLESSSMSVLFWSRKSSSWFCGREEGGGREELGRGEGEGREGGGRGRGRGEDERGQMNGGKR